ncbi:MAG TPA: serine/threonine protein kinase [Cyanobacteria bacterium UBA8803]|nr:serine/threonine protein kinase [Cyanobacteria bacterium UBA8803]
MKDCIALVVTEMSQVGEARRSAIALASELEFKETERGKVAIVVTEAAKNLLEHAENGELILQPLNTYEGKGIEIVALDRGPGMRNLFECLQDGFSTAGTMGTGLGAIQRLCDRFDIHSVPDVGTALVTQLWSRKEPGESREGCSSSCSTPPSLEIGVIQLPKPGQDVSGDAWAVENHGDRTLVLVADGLGSGPFAGEASQAAVRILQANARLQPKAILELAHAALRSTRGAAVAIAEINLTEQTLRFAGIGNIAGVILRGAESQSLVSYNGTVGHQFRKIQEFVYPWKPESILIMHSDGLGTQWSLTRYPGLITHHPTLIAGVLYRDFKRSRDDMTVLVLKEME